jgi:hypothetical protein
MLGIYMDIIFWVLRYGERKFKLGVDEKKFNLTSAPLRNTAVTFPYGWTALRFKADNPGRFIVTLNHICIWEWVLFLLKVFIKLGKYRQKLLLVALQRRCS